MKFTPEQIQEAGIKALTAQAIRTKGDALLELQSRLAKFSQSLVTAKEVPKDWEEQFTKLAGEWVDSFAAREEAKAELAALSTRPAEVR